VCAVNGHNLEAVEYILKAGADPNAIPPGGESPLITATLWLSWDPSRAEVIPGIVQTPLKHGADPNKSLPGGRTALVFAASTNDTAAMSLLLKAGADPNVVTDDGTTAFADAVQSGQLNMAKYLIAHGARTEAVDNRSGRIPLHLAVLQGELPMVEVVFPVAADRSAVDCMGMTPLDIALRCGHTRIAELLRNGGAKPRSPRQNR